MTLRSMKRLAVLLLVAFGGAGCGGSGKTPTASGSGKGGETPATGEYAKLVGVWEGSEKVTITVDGKKSEAKGDPIMLKFEFRGNGTMTMDMPLFGVPVHGTWKGTKSEGNKLTIDTVMDMPSLSFESKTENGKTTEKETQTTKKEQETFTIAFETPDRMVMSPNKAPDEPVTLQRKK